MREVQRYWIRDILSFPSFASVRYTTNQLPLLLLVATTCFMIWTPVAAWFTSKSVSELLVYLSVDSESESGLSKFEWRSESSLFDCELVKTVMSSSPPSSTSRLDGILQFTESRMVHFADEVDHFDKLSRAIHVLSGPWRSVLQVAADMDRSGILRQMQSPRARQLHRASYSSHLHGNSMSRLADGTFEGLKDRRSLYILLFVPLVSFSHHLHLLSSFLGNDSGGHVLVVMSSTKKITETIAMEYAGPYKNRSETVQFPLMVFPLQHNKSRCHECVCMLAHVHVRKHNHHTTASVESFNSPIPSMHVHVRKHNHTTQVHERKHNHTTTAVESFNSPIPSSATNHQDAMNTTDKSTNKSVQRNDFLNLSASRKYHCAIYIYIYISIMSILWAILRIIYLYIHMYIGNGLRRNERLISFQFVSYGIHTCNQYKRIAG
jgi:hypothetical protein